MPPLKLSVGKLKLNTSDLGNAPSASPATAATPTPSSTGGPKIKLKSSQPPTPAAVAEPRVEPLAPPPTKPKRPYNKKPKPNAENATGIKRAAETDISPATAKRRVSVILKPRNSTSSAIDDNENALQTPASATSTKIKLGAPRRQSSGPKNLVLTAKKRPPPRPIGVGYDSDASDAELDPAIEQQFILRMAPGRDCEYVREAIANKSIGLRAEEGGADVSLRFLDRELRRALVLVRGNKYAAVLVDLPCIVEGMKSWDRRGWWKVADICQMLLVLGACRTEQEAKDFALPREVDQHTFAYAHGLTPPMHWVRKRRFRKRVNYREIENVEEEVERLLKEDAAAKRAGGKVEWKVYDRDPANVAAGAAGQDNQDDDEDADADGDEDDMMEDGYIETTEDGFGRSRLADDVDGDEEDDDDGGDDEEFDEGLAAELAAGLEEDDDGNQIVTLNSAAAANLTDILVETPTSGLHIVDTPAAISTSAAGDSDADSPAHANDAASSDEDDDEDDFDSPGAADAVDEDAIELQQQQAQQREEVEDLEREVENARLQVERTANQLLKQRARQNLRALEDELSMKRKAFGMDDVDE